MSRRSRGSRLKHTVGTNVGLGQHRCFFWAAGQSLPPLLGPNSSCVRWCVVPAVNGSRTGRPKLETFYPNVTEFNLWLPNRSTRYKLELSALTRVGSGEVLVEELPHFTNEGFRSLHFTIGSFISMCCTVTLAHDICAYISGFRPTHIFKTLPHFLSCLANQLLKRLN